MREFLNRNLDRAARTHFRVFRKPLPAYQVCGYTGFAVGLVQSLILTKSLGLSLSILAGMTGVVILTFYGLVMATKIITGEEQIIYYHHEIAIMIMIALFLRLTHQPLLPYLDIGILGIGLFLAFGRMGCLMVGCCHGCPARVGVCYRPAHGRAGVPDCLVGVRLFPIQAVESLFVLCVVLVGDALLASGRRPGAALELYTVVYGCARFSFEFLRGDIDRPYSLGFSQAQWISLLLISTLMWAEFRGAIPFHLWHAFAFGTLLMTMAVVVLARRFASAPRHLLLHPKHMQEIAAALTQVFDIPGSTGGAAPVACTSQGIQISGGLIDKQGQRTFHYALSARNSPLPQAWARVLVGFIVRLRHPYAGSYSLRQGSSGVCHLLVPVSQAIPFSG
jgi:hypothetical protein